MKKIAAILGMVLVLGLIFGCAPIQDEQVADVQEPNEDVPEDINLNDEMVETEPIADASDAEPEADVAEGDAEAEPEADVAEGDAEAEPEADVAEGDAESES